MVGRNPKCSNCGPLQRHACAECCLCKPDVVEDGEVVRNGSFCQTCRNKHKRLPAENLCRCTLKRVCPQHLGAGGGFCLECRRAKMACNDCCRCTAIAFCPKCYGKVRQLRSKRRAEVGCGCQGAGSCESCAACECTPRRVPCFYCGAVNNFREACGVLQRFIYTNTFAAADAMRAIQAISIEIRQPRPDILKAITDALSKPRDDAPETLLPPVMRNPRHQLQGMAPLLPAPRPKKRGPKKKKLNPIEAATGSTTLHPTLKDYANASASMTTLLAIEPPPSSDAPDLLSLEVLPDPMSMDEAGTGMRTCPDPAMESMDNSNNTGNAPQSAPNLPQTSPEAGGPLGPHCIENSQRETSMPSNMPSPSIMSMGPSLRMHAHHHHHHHPPPLGIDVAVSGAGTSAAVQLHVSFSPGGPGHMFSSHGAGTTMAHMHQFSSHVGGGGGGHSGSQMLAFSPSQQGAAAVHQMRAFSQGAAAHMQHLAAAIHRSPPSGGQQISMSLQTATSAVQQSASSPGTGGLTLDELQERMDQYPLESLDRHDSPIKNESGNGGRLCG